MKIASIVMFRDEADILPAYLKHMEKHVDYFLWLDNGSTDNGAEIVKAHPKTVFFDTESEPFKTSLMDRLWVEVQNYISNDDWVCMGAPDAWPLFNVRKEIAQADQEGHCSITTFFPTFFFTKEMYANYLANYKYRRKINNFNPVNFKYYRNVSAYTIIIIKNVKDKDGHVRYTQNRQEPPLIPGGRKTKFSKLCFGHYRFRSPQQMKLRLEQRKEANPTRKKHKSFFHYCSWDWKDYLIPEEKLFRYEGGGIFKPDRSSFELILNKNLTGKNARRQK